jgi:plastocyanin
MRRCLVGFVLALACLALPAVAAAKTRVVYAGGPVAFQSQIGNKYGGSVNNFMLQRITINVGDSVVWNGKSLSNGFHTVDIPAKGGSDLALITPSGGTVPNTVVDAGGNPFWFDGKVPNLGLNPMLLAPSGAKTYNGHSRIDSGLPLGPKPVDFKVKFTKAGTYEYFCDVHPGMHGWVIVRPDGKKVPSAKADAKALKASEKHYVAEVKALAKTNVTGANVQLGAAKPDGAEILAFFPATLQVNAGTTVTFMMAKNTRETHTASFGPNDYLNTQANNFIGPTGGVNPIAAFPSDPPGSITLTPTSHGNGFANTGVLDQDPATVTIPASGKIDFTTPGTYHYICLIHSFMHGTIVVK